MALSSAFITSVYEEYESDITVSGSCTPPRPHLFYFQPDAKGNDTKLKETTTQSPAFHLIFHTNLRSSCSPPQPVTLEWLQQVSEKDPDEKQEGLKLAVGLFLVMCIEIIDIWID